MLVGKKMKVQIEDEVKLCGGRILTVSAYFYYFIFCITKHDQVMQNTPTH